MAGEGLQDWLEKKKMINKADYPRCMTAHQAVIATENDEEHGDYNRNQ